MRVRRFTARRRFALTRLLLGLLLLRAYVPAGFMPQGGHPLRVELCPAGMPMSLAMPPSMSMPMPAGADDHPGPRTDHVADCPFGHSPVAGPVTDGIVHAAPAQDPIRRVATLDTRPQRVRLPDAHQARAPPATDLC